MFLLKGCHSIAHIHSREKWRQRELRLPGDALHSHTCLCPRVPTLLLTCTCLPVHTPLVVPRLQGAFRSHSPGWPSHGRVCSSFTLPRRKGLGEGCSWQPPRDHSYKPASWGTADRKLHPDVTEQVAGPGTPCRWGGGERPALTRPATFPQHSNHSCLFLSPLMNSQKSVQPGGRHARHPHPRAPSPKGTLTRGTHSKGHPHPWAPTAKGTHTHGHPHPRAPTPKGTLTQSGWWLRGPGSCRFWFQALDKHKNPFLI